MKKVEEIKVLNTDMSSDEVGHEIERYTPPNRTGNLHPAQWTNSMVYFGEVLKYKCYQNQIHDCSCCSFTYQYWCCHPHNNLQIFSQCLYFAVRIFLCMHIQNIIDSLTKFKDTTLTVSQVLNLIPVLGIKCSNISC